MANILILLTIILTGNAAAKPVSLTFGTNWKAQAEHGGFYQAVAKGIYKKAGLDVKIRQGGPNVNHSQLLAAGRIDFNMGAGLFDAFNYVQNGIPMVMVASIFQKDPQILMNHPGRYRSLQDMKKAKIFISQQARVTYWLWLRARYGFRDEQIRNYTFNPQPFLADKAAVQQGFLTSEPYAIEQRAGFKPDVHLLADSGYHNYSTTIETSLKMMQERPDVVQRFVRASIEGWYSYLYDDPSAANAMIKKDNPGISDGQLAYSRAKMVEYGIVDSGDSKKLGIGALSDKRIDEFFGFVSGAKIYPKSLDYKKSYTTRFVNKGVPGNRTGKRM